MKEEVIIKVYWAELDDPKGERIIDSELMVEDLLDEIARLEKGLNKHMKKPKLSKIQREMLVGKCPHCGEGKLHPVDGEIEIYLYCNNCLCAVDSDGGYTW